MSSFYRPFVSFLLVVLVVLAGGCGRKPRRVARNAPAEQAEPEPRSRDADDLGRFLGGLPGRADSPFAKLEATEAWKVHRRSLDEAWSKAEAGLIRGLRRFQKEELNAEGLRSQHVFYPFSGPDTLTMTLCFPHSPTYVMVGLEPAGTLPAPRQVEKKDLPRYLAEVRETMASELGRSFFITRQMDKQFRGQVTDGLLPPILHLLVRTGHTVLGFRYVRLDDGGRIIERSADYKAPGRFGNKGVRIDFRTDSDQSIHKLFYFSVNLSDERLRENKPFLAWVSRLRGTATLFKATSYMPHRRDFSLIRDAVLSQSAAVLQDDSGIPYRFFRPDAWKVQLYGDYERPYGSFRWLEQPDLRKAYDAPGPKPLNLRIGYGYGRIPSNLLLARRARPAAEQAAR